MHGIEEAIPEEIRTAYGDASGNPSQNPLLSFDGRDWAEAFVHVVEKDPTIATDRDTMAGWFANALMRGWDEHRWRSRRYKAEIRAALYPWWKRWFIPLRKFDR